MTNTFDRTKPNCGVGPAPAGDGTKVLNSPHDVTEGALYKVASDPDRSTDQVIGPRPDLFPMPMPKIPAEHFETVKKSVELVEQLTADSAVQEQLAEEGMKFNTEAIEQVKKDIAEIDAKKWAEAWPPSETVYPAPAETVYTVPPHVGENIEVPEGSKVTTYPISKETMDFAKAAVEKFSADIEAHPAVQAAKAGLLVDGTPYHPIEDFGKKIAEAANSCTDQCCDPGAQAIAKQYDDADFVDGVDIMGDVLAAAQTEMERVFGEVVDKKIAELEDKIITLFNAAGFGKQANKVFGR